MTQQQTDSTMTQAWHTAVQQEVKTRRWLAALLLQKRQQLFSRFVHHYQQLLAAPRKVRRQLGAGLATAALMLALSGTPTPIHAAATITVDPSAAGIVDGDGCSLVEAIINANDGAATYSECAAGSAGANTIVLSGYPNTYTYTTAYGTDAALPDITSVITIQGNEATIERDDTITDEFRLITIANSGNLTLNEAIITGGHLPNGNGGGILNDGGSLTLENYSVIIENGSSRGGGIFNDAGTVHLQESVIGYNNAEHSGGGIHNQGGIITSEASFLAINHLSAIDAVGGSIANDANGQVTLNNTLILYSGATLGGGIGNVSGNVELNNSAVFAGYAYDGGGIYNNGNLTLNDSIITGNEAVDRGGGIHNLGTAVINNSEFYYNDSDGYGGGIYNEGDLTLNNSLLSGNYASGNGGGLHNESGTAVITNSEISDNVSHYGYGGGIYNNASLTLSKSTLSGNYANGSGGGLANRGAGTAVINNSTISDNESYATGGGIYNDGNLEVNQSTISGNIATDWGGGVNNYGTAVFNNSTITQNEALDSDYGGGGISQNAGTLTLNRTIVSGNIALTNTEIDYYDGTITADNFNVLGRAGVDHDQAFYGFTPGINDYDATEDGNAIPTADILNETLADNGGPTLTHALVVGSPAIDFAPTGSAGPIDQRGAARDFDGDGLGSTGNEADAGAVEFRDPQASCEVILGNVTVNEVGFNITDLGALDCLHVEDMGTVNHLFATAGMQTGQWWHIFGTDSFGDRVTSGFELDLTLPYASASGDSRACKWPGNMGGAGWDCGDETDNDADTNVSVTRLGVAGFSDWTIGDNVNPTAVFLQSLTAVSPTLFLPLLLTLLTVLSGATLWLRRKTV